MFALRRRERGEADLTDGAVLLISEGIVRQASPEATGMIGQCAGKPIDDVLRRFFDTNAQPALDAVSALESSGEGFTILLRSGTGAGYEVIGTPVGGLIRLVLRDASFWERRLSDAVAQARAADAAAERLSWEQQTLRGLIADAPIIAWNRNAEGTVHWSSGTISTPSGLVEARDAVRQFIARTRPRQGPDDAGRAQKWRIEMVLNDRDETASLHVVEVWRGDDTFIGFATDASNAVSAERTLTRFVQTMTETFAHLTVGLAIFDRNQTLALFNPTMLQMWQVEPAWLARRPSLRDIVDELRASRRLPELKDFHDWRARLLSLFEDTEKADYEELWNLADGSIIRVLARPHPHGSLAFIFDDVTERMRLEQRYRHSIELRRVSLDNLDEGVAVFGANGLLQFVNQAFHQIWQTDSETIYPAMHARHVSNLCLELSDEPDLWQRFYAFVTVDENRTEWGTTLTTIHGRRLMARFAPLPDGSAMAVFSDITMPEQVALDLIETQVARRHSDAVRELLVMALGGALPDDGAPAHARLPAPTRDEVADLMALPLRPEDCADPGEPVDLNAVLDQTRLILAPRAAEAGTTLALDAADPAHTTRLEPSLARSIAFLMTENAIGLAPPESVISLSAQVDPGSALLCAEVTDPGGAPVVIPHLGDAMRDLRRLVVGHGGHVSQRPDASDAAIRVVCAFEVEHANETDPDTALDHDGNDRSAATGG